eukprot:GGOE01013303.1.p2 GENE.GGOE01013303.1~~GGOE01013303.1.p2  ORF type:complete len:111 (-),score=4.52 GGOE01013303.1:200-532(-)
MALVPCDAIPSAGHTPECAAENTPCRYLHALCLGSARQRHGISRRWGQLCKDLRPDDFFRKLTKTSSPSPLRVPYSLCPLAQIKHKFLLAGALGLPGCIVCFHAAGGCEA